jgi:hypothetical protein
MLTSVHSLEYPVSPGEQMGDFPRPVHAKRNLASAVVPDEQQRFHFDPTFAIAR